MDTLAVLASALGLGFLAGIRLYATVLAAGLGIRFGILHVGGSLSHLAVLADWRVVAVAGTLYLMEFLADKIPWLDSTWDAVHTFIRPLGAAFVAATALGTLDPVAKTCAILVSGAVALSSHSSKASLRLAVNHSPEPFSNIALSLLEDIFVPVGTWAAISHPWIMLGIVSVFLVAFLWLARKIIRTLHRYWRPQAVQS